MREEADADALNRVMIRYSDGLLDVRFIELIHRLDEIYVDPDAIRSTIRVLDTLRDGSGALVRLSDGAIEGAARFMAHAGDLPAADREAMLRAIVRGDAADVENVLLFFKEAPDRESVAGVAQLFSRVERCVVP